MTQSVATLVGIPLLREVLQHVDDHPEELAQDWWAHDASDCGTTACIAGHTVRTAGWTFYWEEGLDGEFTATFCEKDGERRQICDVAQELLDLNDIERVRLFYGCADRHEIQHVAEGIAERRGETL